MKTPATIQAAYGDVRLFNTLAGNLKNVSASSIDNQISFIFEELEETITAMECGDAVGVLDGACDLFVTVAGLMQKLEAAGFNVAEALDRVNANNLTKFPKRTDLFAYPPEFKVELNVEHGRYVIKDEAGKVRKPIGFVPVNLTDLVAAGVIA